ncbi:MAG: outer membrane beta-barrel protein [Flavobacteriales bacterium]|nr:outer membrane beta-barrel protein [Flavobacteriales bacterium]MBK6945367.1 outer membrane beta-barrel protein [Flavobacteriales bacterium]MBK7241480.1 outer membrane beta-barrel protein [Flavobacteriales bacterium]MBK7298477.1 outer membrane beta-barrel protein [Flavobacteriales bacterium]MBK9535075.1 outer membrane beta-barrel protein [Flavobacteriales bacterium]
MRHQKILLSLTVLTVLSLSSSAQEVYLGGGYNSSNLLKQGEERWTGRSGYQLGADIRSVNVWFAQFGAHLLVRNLNYSLTGLDSAGVVALGNTEFRYTDRSLRVPLMVGRHLLNPKDGSAVNAYLMAGPTVIFPLSTELNNSALNVTTNGSQWYLGATGGLTIKFLFVETGYSFAMSNVFKGDTFQTDPRINLFHITGGVRLRLAQ